MLIKPTKKEANLKWDLEKLPTLLKETIKKYFNTKQINHLVYAPKDTITKAEGWSELKKLVTYEDSKMYRAFHTKNFWLWIKFEPSEEFANYSDDK